MKLCFKPVCRVVFVAAGREMVFQLGNGGASMAVVAGRLG